MNTLVADEATDLAPDGWLEASGVSHALKAALKQTAPRGTVVVPDLFGPAAAPDVKQLDHREIRLQRSHGSWAVDYHHALNVLSANRQLWSSLLSMSPPRLCWYQMQTDAPARVAHGKVDAAAPPRALPPAPMSSPLEP